ncbi:MAG: hypothetical protein ACTSP3_04440 [Candidatus Heimdallarchaeaceae archaeon]
MTEGAFIRCLTAIGLYKGEISVKNFKTLDTRGNDLRRLFNQLGIVEKTTKQSKVMRFTKMGIQLYENIDDQRKFSDLLHAILISKIPQYRILADFLVSHEKKMHKNKKSIFMELKEKQSSSGWNLPEPTFNSLMVLAELSKLIEINENLEVKRINSTHFYLDIFRRCFEVQKQKTTLNHFSTYDILECFRNTLIEVNNEITLDIAFELLKSLSDDLKIRFIFGVGQEIGKSFIPGTHAIIELTGDN